MTFIGPRLLSVVSVMVSSPVIVTLPPERVQSGTLPLNAGLGASRKASANSFFFGHAFAIAASSSAGLKFRAVALLSRSTNPESASVKPSHHWLAALLLFAAVICVRTLAVSVSVSFFWVRSDSASSGLPRPGRSANERRRP